jgi:orotate phosphoribosyltransferase
VEALRASDLHVSAAICVVDREEGGAEAITAAGVPFKALYTTSQLGVGTASANA